MFLKSELLGNAESRPEVADNNHQAVGTDKETLEPASQLEQSDHEVQPEQVAAPEETGSPSQLPLI
ncbi:hypothetical protein DBADOPDK_06206 [Pseudomonas sp. MM223]|nr:hypothetical protein DBADOPDK_06206 [Pseudomonas sp. MM223]